MSRVISDSQQTIVRASQLGDTIVSVKKPAIVVGGAPGIGFFSVILNIDVVFKSITLLCTDTNTLQNFDHNETCQVTATTLFTGDGDVTAAVEGTFAIEAAPSSALVTTPDQENLLSNAGSFPALDAAPSFDVT